MPKKIFFEASSFGIGKLSPVQETKGRLWVAVHFCLQLVDNSLFLVYTKVVNYFRENTLYLQLVDNSKIKHFTKLINLPKKGRIAMDVKKLIMQALERKGQVKTSDIVKLTGFSRAYVNRFFQDLKGKGKIILLGKANRARYVLADSKAVNRAREKICDITLSLQNRNLLEDKVLAGIKKQTGILLNIRENILQILEYAFSEMLNNAIEHSNSKMIKVAIEKDKNNVFFSIIDYGIGIFNNIMKKKKLQNAIEAIQDLLKGKQTTAPEMHTGEGIFFTSKAADVFIIQGSSKKLIFNNILKDIFINDIKEITGTKVSFSISLSSKKNLSEIFRQYTDSSFEFNKTTVTIRLYKMESQYISRSQAGRIVSGLDKFKTVTLDFKDIKTVGQGFADEIFRVWKMRHPNISIITINANENVEFMIERAKKE